MVKHMRRLFRSAESARHSAALPRIRRQKNAHRLKVGTTQDWDQTEIGSVHHVTSGTPVCNQAYRLRVEQMNEV
jgi:hypothetical protein